MQKTKYFSADQIFGWAMLLGIFILVLLIYRDFSPLLYEDWGRALATALKNFNSNLAGK